MWLPRGRRICLVSDRRVFGLFGKKIASALRRAGAAPLTHLFSGGEKDKSWGAVEALLRDMVRGGVGRDSALVAVGGGAVTDAAGFAASIYLRGIPWISVPTTLLGQLDSGIGGKVAINLPEGKNLVGAFWQPARIVCDTAFLKKLPARELVSGLAEAIKYGLVFDPALWEFIRGRWDALAGGDPAALSSVIRRGAAWKIKVVSADLRETGRRELLNFGHTLGHALETVAGYGALRHGEAVIWGMRAALRLSVRHAGLDPARARGVEEFLRGLGVRIPAGLKSRQILATTRRDKKARGGRIRFVLLRRLGSPVVRGGISDRAILETVEALL